jgi:hypothetical protein
LSDPSEDPAGEDPASSVCDVLHRLHSTAPSGGFTLGWLIDGLDRHSFGVIILLLAVIALVPGVSIIAGLLLLISGGEMALGHDAPTFPRRIATHRLPMRHLTAVLGRAVPVLRWLEKFTHPRWPTPRTATQRVVGALIALLSLALIGIPIPLGNVIVALVIGTVALAYLEEDSLLLAIGIMLSVAVLALTSVLARAALLGASWLGHLW